MASSIESKLGSAALAEPGALVVHGAVSWPKWFIIHFVSLLCANESRLSTAGRDLPSHSLNSNRSQPRWQSMARPWKTAYSTGGSALASSIESKLGSAALAEPGALVLHGAVSWPKWSS